MSLAENSFIYPNYKQVISRAGVSMPYFTKRAAYTRNVASVTCLGVGNGPHTTVGCRLSTTKMKSKGWSTAPFRTENLPMSNFENCISDSKQA